MFSQIHSDFVDQRCQSFTANFPSGTIKFNRTFRRACSSGGFSGMFRINHEGSLRLPCVCCATLWGWNRRQTERMVQRLQQNKSFIKWGVQLWPNPWLHLLHQSFSVGRATLTVVVVGNSAIYSIFFISFFIRHFWLNAFCSENIRNDRFTVRTFLLDVCVCELCVSSVVWCKDTDYLYYIGPQSLTRMKWTNKDCVLCKTSLFYF